MADEKRRQFLKIAGLSTVCAAWCVPVATALAKGVAGAGQAEGQKHWAMLINVRLCLQREGCSACFDACHTAHNVPKIENPRHEIKWIWKEQYEHAFPEQAHQFTQDGLKGKPVTVLCNHCDRPSCTRVCPTKATWKRESDGIVMMDQHRCIGCRYCIVACPYGARSFNFMDPTPHISCRQRGNAAMVFGDLSDPNSAASRILRNAHSIRRKPNLGTSPNVFYVI
jgi:Fe-S-cluster-containing dehydrogenase component